MEDILASIRRIIADDHENLRQDEEPAPVSSPVRSVLDITERHIAAVPALEPVAAMELDEEDSLPEAGAVHLDEDFYPDTDLQDPEPPVARSVAAKANAPKPAQAPFEPMTTAPQEPLLSDRTAASVADSFNRLGATLMPAEPKTLEDLMKDMLRPMLKAWLDDNLPSIVERLVQAEIERASRGLR